MLLIKVPEGGSRAEWEILTLERFLKITLKYSHSMYRRSVAFASGMTSLYQAATVILEPVVQLNKIQSFRQDSALD